MAYTPKTWTTGETITAAELTTIEQGVQAAAAAADTANTGLGSKVNSSTYTAGLAGKADFPAGGTDGQALVKAGTTTAWATVSGGGAVTDATTAAKGIVQLAGDLGGTAAVPTVTGGTHHGHAATQITGLSTVATTGAYADLSAKPTIPTVGAAGAGAAVALSSTDASVTNARTPTAHTHPASDIASGTITPARLGTGTTDSTTVLYGDGTWKTAPTGGGATTNLVPRYGITSGPNYWVFGHSWTVGQGASNGIGYAQRVGKSQDFYQATYAGSGGQTVKDTTITVLKYNFFGTASGFVLVDTGINDYGNIIDTADWPGHQAIAGDALRTLFRRIRSSTTVDNSAGGCVYTGTWTAVADTNTLGATDYKKTTTQNDYVDVTFSGDTVTFAFQGLHSTSPGALASASNGAAYSISNGGTVLATGSTGYAAGAGMNGTAPTSKTITGLGAGSHTLRLTKTDATGTELRFDGVMVEVANPATILFVIDPDVPSKAAGSSAAWASIVNTVIGEMAVTGSALAVTPTGWNSSTMVQTSDNLHPNDRGHTFMRDAVLTAIGTLGYRSGQNTMN